MILSTISDSAQNDSNQQFDAINNSEELVEAGSNPKSEPISDPKVVAYTNKRYFPQNLFRSRLVPEVMLVAIGMINQLATEGV